MGFDPRLILDLHDAAREAAHAVARQSFALDPESDVQIYAHVGITQNQAMTSGPVDHPPLCVDAASLTLDIRDPLAMSAHQRLAREERKSAWMSSITSTHLALFQAIHAALPWLHSPLGAITIFWKTYASNEPVRLLMQMNHANLHLMGNHRTLHASGLVRIMDIAQDLDPATSMFRLTNTTTIAAATHEQAMVVLRGMHPS